MIKIIFLAGALMAMIVPAAFAGPACYGPAERDAENLLRLHSELMVITVTCRQGSQGESLVHGYTAFTNNNISALHKAEHIMTSYYNSNGGDGQDQLDRLRTRLGNEVSQRIVDMGSAQKFCDANRDRVLRFEHAGTKDVSDEVERLNGTNATYVSLCR